ASDRRCSPTADGMTTALDTTLELETPEHIAFRYQLAGRARRAAAYAVDLVVRGAILFVVALVLLLTSSAGFEDLAVFCVGARLLIFFGVEWFSFAVLDMLAEVASVGKRALRLRVGHQDGWPIALARCIRRNIVRWTDKQPMFYRIDVVAL